MKINLKDFKADESFEVTHEYEADHENLAFDDQKFLSPIRFSAVVKKEGGCLFVEGNLTASLERHCARCLSAVPQLLQEAVRLIFDLDLDREELDVTEDVREILIFQHPIKFLCSPDCKGLCERCGVNKNFEKCTCVPVSKLSPFEKLREKI